MMEEWALFAIIPRAPMTTGIFLVLRFRISPICFKTFIGPQFLVGLDRHIYVNWDNHIGEEVRFLSEICLYNI